MACAVLVCLLFLLGTDAYAPRYRSQNDDRMSTPHQ